MHRLTINQLGPIQHCKLDIRGTTILTGYQASGKSTIAKAVYFLRSLKEDLLQLILRRETEDAAVLLLHLDLTTDFEMIVRNKFLNTVGSSYGMDTNMTLEYNYTENTRIGISLKEAFQSPNYVWVEYSAIFRQFLGGIHSADIKRDELQKNLIALFDDPYEAVYIPAGRSILTLLSGQLNYIYSTMDDMQKRLLDPCTGDYIDRVMKLCLQYSVALDGLLEDVHVSIAHRKLMGEARLLCCQFLKENYSVVDGEELILFDLSRNVKINYASPGKLISV